jgi:CheY-like chemotaxis protein
LDHRQSTFTVLVVEDEWLLRADIVAYLRAAGWRVIEASSGETAMALVEDGAPIDVLFTDIALGGHIDGWDLGEKMRALRPGSGVIYASGRYDEPRRPVAGSVALEKPYMRDEVLHACMSACAVGHPERLN